MISMDEGDDKKLASCFVENGIMEVVKVWAQRTTWFSSVSRACKKTDSMEMVDRPLESRPSA